MSRLICTLALLVATGCAVVDAHDSFDQSADFAAYTTFAQAASPAPTGASEIPGYSSITADQIQSAIKADLESKGLTAVPRETAQLLASFTVSGKAETEVWGTAGYGWGGDLQTTPYVQGTLVIDLYDLERKKLVWHGWGQRKIFGSSFDAELVAEAVHEILAGYPPGKKDS